MTGSRSLVSARDDFLPGNSDLYWRLADVSYAIEGCAPNL